MSNSLENLLTRGMFQPEGLVLTLASPLSVRAHLLQNGTSGCFREVKTLAKTAEGCVKVVIFIPDGRSYALKKYSKERLTKLRNFQARREVHLHSNFHHRAICPLYAAWEDDKEICMLMEYLSAGDLYKHLQNRPLHESIAVPRVVAPLLEGLEYLHDRNIIHRDIKLENIFVTDSSVRLADFGLSICVEEERPVTRLGTLPYMSIEVLSGVLKNDPMDAKEREDLEYDFGCDVWALGVLTFEVLTGQLPFKGTTRHEIIASIDRGVVFPPYVSDEALDFVLSALTLDPLARPSARDLLRHPWVTRYRPAEARPVHSERLPNPGSSVVATNSFVHRSQASMVTMKKAYPYGASSILLENRENSLGKGPKGPAAVGQRQAVRRVPPPGPTVKPQSATDFALPPGFVNPTGLRPAVASREAGLPGERAGGFLKVLGRLFLWKKGRKEMEAGRSGKKEGKVKKPVSEPQPNAGSKEREELWSGDAPPAAPRISLDPAFPPLYAPTYKVHLENAANPQKESLSQGAFPGLPQGLFESNAQPYSAALVQLTTPSDTQLSTGGRHGSHVQAVQAQSTQYTASPLGNHNAIGPPAMPGHAAATVAIPQRSGASLTVQGSASLGLGWNTNGVRHASPPHAFYSEANQAPSVQERISTER